MSARVAVLARDILARAEGRRRYVFAVAGAPGAGKSTLAEALVAAFEGMAPGAAALMPMDGFHLDNAVLTERGLLRRKGAPETFDAGGFAATLARVRASTEPIAVPVFDRGLDLARAGGRIIEADRRVIVVEGNYLLLGDAPWSDIAAHFDRTLFLRIDEATLTQRLVDRWIGYGLAPEAARSRAEGNDLPNARLVMERSVPADVTWEGM